MDNNQLAFAASPLCLTSRTSSVSSTFTGASRQPLVRPTILPSWHTQRNNRARIVALGGAAPPPPEDESSKPEGEDETAANDDVKGDEPVAEEGVNEVTADDILNSPTFLKKKLEILQKEVIEVKQKMDKSEEALDEEKQRYVRLAADFENYRRRSIEDLRESETKSVAKVCKEIISVLDNFERAQKAVTATTENEIAISNSFQSINKQLLDSLTKLKVEPINAVGEIFDPEFHEAIQRLESNEYAEDVICQQYSRGYKISETLIRAAVVGVSAGPGPADGDAEESPSEDDTTAEQKEEVQQAAEGL